MPPITYPLLTEDKVDVYTQTSDIPVDIRTSSQTEPISTEPSDFFTQEAKTYCDHNIKLTSITEDTEYPSAFDILGDLAPVFDEPEDKLSGNSKMPEQSGMTSLKKRSTSFPDTYYGICNLPTPDWEDWFDECSAIRNLSLMKESVIIPMGMSPIPMIKDNSSTPKTLIESSPRLAPTLYDVLPANATFSPVKNLSRFRYSSSDIDSDRPRINTTYTPTSKLPYSPVITLNNATYTCVKSSELMTSFQDSGNSTFTVNNVDILGPGPRVQRQRARIQSLPAATVAKRPAPRTLRWKKK